jgi:DNA-binding SARP family transcriptional activator
MVYQCSDGDGIKIELLGSFGVQARGRELRLPPSVQRVLAALAILDHNHDRPLLAATLYPDARPQQVSANLRSALWRARREAGEELVQCTGQRISLRGSVHVDLHEWAQKARLLVSGSIALPPEGDGGKLLQAFSQELLPSWNDDWLTLERQRWDHLRLHALELLAERLGGVGRHVDALEAGLEAVSIEPYRESAHRALISAYLAEGNSASAIAQYSRYKRTIMRDLGLRPTSKMEALMRNVAGE